MAQAYRMLYDHHTHTVYSHGKGSIEDNVRVAAAKGLSSIAITDHGPGHLTYGVDLGKVSEMRAEIERLKAVYPTVRVLLGVEANTLRRAPYLDVGEADKQKLDILLAGYHYGVTRAGCVPNYLYQHVGLFRGGDAALRRKNTEMICDALCHNHIDVLTHPGDKGPFDLDEIAHVCAQTGTLMEINMKHAHLTTQEIRQVARFDVKFIIGSDAHVPEAVGEYQASLARALEAGLDPARIVNIGRR